MTLKKKLIEVALPLEAINIAAAKEKSIRHGHPSTLHPWWARRPLAAARAVIFAQMVDDPSGHPDIFRTEKAQEKERQRLFRIIEDLVKWENTTNEEVLGRAKAEIWQSWRAACAENIDHPRYDELFDRYALPAFHDPFAGGGALPLEAQRLGLASYASDLNPVAVLINKAMIEVPDKFSGRSPVNPDVRSKRDLIAREWRGAQGLAEDVRYYGQWMRNEAEKRIGHLYPKVEITPEMAKSRPDLKAYVGEKLTVIAWLWARTVKSPDPAFAHVDVPLASTFLLSTKTGKEAYVDPVIEGDRYHFTVRIGKPRNLERAKNGTKVGRGGHFTCLMSGAPIPVTYIRAQGISGTLGSRLMAMVVETSNGRVYLSPDDVAEGVALSAKPHWFPDQDINHNPRDIRTQLYGLMRYGDLFTNRQLTALSTFSDLAIEVRKAVKRDAVRAGLLDDNRSLENSGVGATGYSDAVAMYLGLAVSKQSVFLVSLARWRAGEGKSAPAFGRQALAMVWDFADLNPFAGSGGDFLGIVEGVQKTLWNVPSLASGRAEQADAATQSISIDKVISTDPPYYDNIGYADLSDYFYVWLRRSLKEVFPDLFATVVVPKREELVASPHRHGGKDQAEAFFLKGMTQAMTRLAEQAHPAFPVTIYYAFKQSENDDEGGTASTGWDTFLEAVIRAGFAITGTWPMRTENQTRLVGMVTNSLASSVILVCRPRMSIAPRATRREFVAALKSELPAALTHLQRGNIAPVDLAQAAIGPGMAVFTRYSTVIEADGKPFSVRSALSLINQILDEALAEQEGDFDVESRWAIAWFEQSGFEVGEYGAAETLSRAKNTSISVLVEEHVVASKAGKVRLLRPDELPTTWVPSTNSHSPAWGVVHQLIRVLEAGGETSAAELVTKLGNRANVARELAYRLYTVCERKKRAPEALSYNALVQSWPEIVRLAQDNANTATAPQQTDLYS